jgi:hypothetical protein
LHPRYLISIFEPDSGCTLMPIPFVALHGRY